MSIIARFSSVVSCFALVVCAVASDIDAQRVHYRKTLISDEPMEAFVQAWLAGVGPDEIETIRQALISGDLQANSMAAFVQTWLAGVGPDEIETIRDAIAVGDEVIDKYVMSHLYWRVNLYVSGLPIQMPEYLLPEMASDEVVRRFVLDNLESPKLSHGVFLVAAILYKEDADIMSRLANVGLRNEYYARLILTAAMLARVEHPSIDRLVLRSLKSHCALLSSEAAHYLSRFPNPETLPRLVDMLMKPDAKLYFEASTAPEKRIDMFRFSVLVALLTYDGRALADYAERILSAREMAGLEFGQRSLPLYERLVQKIEPVLD